MKVSYCLIVTLSFVLAGSVFALDTTDDRTGTITAQGENLASGEGAAQAFDNSTDTKWLDFSPNGSWIQYQYAFGKRSVVTQYTLTSANDFPERDPMNWNLLGSNDGGATWVTLDTRTNQTFASRFLKQSFLFTNSTAYNIYRLNITALKGPNPNSIQLAEIEFIGTLPAPPAKAVDPSPADGAANVSAVPALSWTAGSIARSHDVYFGTDIDDINNAERLFSDLNGNGIVDWPDVSVLTAYWLLDPAGSEPYAAMDDDSIIDLFDFSLLAPDWMNSADPAFKGNRFSNNFNPGQLALDTTYYWRIDEVNGPNTVKGDIWSFSTQSGRAYNPNPANGAAAVATNLSLSWSAGAGATSHNVYFGTANPPAFAGNQAAATYNPGTLQNSKAYYWRIDELGSTGTLQGDLWSFTTQALVNANLRKGPYLIYPGTNTQMMVLWQIDATTGCSIAWGTTTSYSSGSDTTTEYGSDHQHKYTITGLTPGTKYYYRVTIGSNNYTGSFIAAPASSAADAKFFMYGDTRSNGSSNNTVCGQMISAYNADAAYQTMVLHAGDWVESDSESTYTSQWYNYSWTNLMTATANMAFMGTIGNHEGGAGVWKKYHPFPFVASRYYYSYDYGPVHVAVVDQYTTYTSGSAQYTWLVNDLSTSTKPFKIIVLHQPGWSCGGGHDNDGTVQSTIQPLCTQHGVQIVLGGHNHYYSRGVVSGVQHLTHGGGGAGLYTPSAGANIVTYTKSLAVSKVAISGDTLTCTTINESGSVIDTFSVTGN